eukprot:CAMPEP_0113426702 /NCGR_PEP_ID=MMETSP0013_2-20120614/30884_1 /TAXON_ID=2843 ORGANISM="Skeletonema costatum, Strain 1716" /NCGR_SAMPLE_ID=MMETSP0013_2 /ASSEMBLY_ACC=CAM_ASM_000158 /LENGTH=461 /DNA_ID=CAMNT_0000315029 /DNA_START=98 /DNA_END=1481 /DNA_ORIENTATION=+ /assembly_acc=CAM_ASM_000158
MSGTDDIVATRKLTDSETATLRSILKSQLNIKAGDAQDEEDAGDLLDYAFAMIANGRNVECVKDELKSMELEVCPAESAQKVGRSLSKFLLDLDNKAGGSSQPLSDAATPKKESSGKVVTNALTSSGALGSSRQRKSNNDSGNNNSNRNDGRRGDGKQQQRSVHGAAFDRLRNTSNNNQRNNNNNNNNRTQHQSYDDRGRGGPHRPPMNQSRGQNHHERGNDSRRGRDDWGGRGGRGGRGHGGRGEPSRGGGRGESRGGGGRGRGGRQDNMSGGKRRQREEEDFVPASPMDRGLQSSRTGDEPMRQGRGGRNNHGDMQSHEGKRARHEEQSNDNNYAQQGNDIGAPTTGKRVEEVEEDDFPEEEENALVGGEGASLALFIPTNKTPSKKVEMARQMPQLMLQLYPNHHLSQVISQAEEVLEVVVEVEAVADLLMEEEEVGEVVQRWLNCYQPKLGLDLAQW